MITIPVAVNNEMFKWQADLWWWNHKQTYGDQARDRALLLMIDKNLSHEQFRSRDWYQDIPHVEATGVWSAPVVGVKDPGSSTPLNIQFGLKQILSRFADDTILEIVDCDLFHFRRAPEISVTKDTLLVCDLYENWHVLSKTKNRKIIEPYFKNQGRYYNGGFVPIIGQAATFKKIIQLWEDIHRDILTTDNDPNSILWWAGMFALQAACENLAVNMIAKDWCYIPEVNRLLDQHYTGHYSVDKVFNKRFFPNVKLENFPDNLYYNRMYQWIMARDTR